MFTPNKQLYVVNVIQYLYNMWSDQFSGEVPLRFWYHRNRLLLYVIVHTPSTPKWNDVTTK